MKACPFEVSPQRLPTFDKRMAERFATVRREAERLLADVPVADDGRRGFGTVYAIGPLRREGLVLEWWRWRGADPTSCPESIGASMFCDDPLGAAATDPLAVRAASASAFVEAANAMFDPDDVRFVLRPLEVVAAGVDGPAVVIRDGDADLLAVDLMAGLSNRAVIDRLVREELGEDLRRAQALSGAGNLLRLLVWHRAERLNAARAILDPASPAIKVPGSAPLERRAQTVVETLRAAHA